MSTSTTYCNYPCQVFLKPSEIFYSQDSISSIFGDERSVQEAVEGVLLKKFAVQDFPVIQVVRRLDGKYYSLDNRRLYIFRVGQYYGTVTRVPVKIVKERPCHKKKFTSKNGGTEIRVRGGVLHLPRLENQLE